MADLKELSKRIHENIGNGVVDYGLNEEIIKLLSLVSDDEKKKYAEEFSAEMGKSAEMDIWLYSFMLEMYPNPVMLKELITYVRFCDELDYKQKYFIFNQVNSLIFRYKIYNTEDVVSTAWRLLESIEKECEVALGVSLKPIPVAERNKGIAIVLVEQFLTPEHGPTKTALDRCYVLKKYYGQNVMLINTAEMPSEENIICMQDIFFANYRDDLCNENTVSWQGETFNYYQCSKAMPTDEGLEEIIEFVANLKPSSITLVGGTSLLAGMLNKLIPVITVGTILSRVAMTLSEYQIIDFNMLEEVCEMLERMGKSKEHVIPGRFTYSLKPQTNKFSRTYLGIPEDRFALAMVGGRLTDEITDEFLCMLENCMDEDMVAGVIGTCDDFDEKLSAHPQLKGKLIYVGFVDDIQAVIENFDLYVNPTRRGGGTSVVEAMSKGLPAVTVNYGDVAGIVGEGFICEDYEEMAELIKRYKNDKAFYDKQSEKALSVAADYLDSVKEFSRIMNVYYSKQGYTVNTNS